jgi:hypothetical protein
MSRTMPTPERYSPMTPAYADITTEAEVRDIALRIACARSPENISCDGEASLASIRRAHAFLNRHEQALQAAAYRIGVPLSQVRAWARDY